ncbi:hypothetical protein [Lentilactobacillus kefiri]|uniref:Uncharacterized protein n=2 Tax=Lentilactobacillus kefiri TaxID=33962 RepID=A0A8E1V001_LENKE|nr:hypothetical protein [Lentilactobacillus kefiri]KRL62140.1 hypothetical protein FD08_GL002745 [Lentilactobacillus parakefiri DSM 10551]KRM50222.1 hypothetical protein FC95_GL002064 [Lentilactobacillus kefiri DSM 20587 = JCM 5818]MCJ2162432.1 hypothetical protein [Lentilactobacillus kefiri]MCP9369870.1 hypothetical protein [Lentilactobacillus kefiri]MDH5109660.1 hypothetical protein [Lentilactobacillus kefiri]
MKKHKTLMLLLVGIGITTGSFFASNVSASSVLKTVPRSMRGTWKEYSPSGSRFYGKDVFRAKSTTEYSYDSHHYTKYSYHLAYYHLANGHPRVNPIYSFGHGRYSIYWGLKGFKYGTMHPSYYRVTTKKIFGHIRPVILEYYGAGFVGTPGVLIRK